MKYEYIYYLFNNHTITVGGELGEKKKKHMFLFNLQRLDNSEITASKILISS